MATKKKVVDLASEEWRVYTTLERIVEAIERQLVAAGKNVEESKCTGYIHGKETPFYKIDYAIATFLDKNYCGECVIQHRPHHEKKDFFRWVEWLGINRSYIESRKAGGKLQPLREITARRKMRALKLK